MRDVDVTTLIARANVVGHARSTTLQHGRDRPAVIVHINPITHVAAVAINWYRFVIQRIGQHQWQELLGELAWPIVVPTSCDHSVESEGVMRGAHELFGGSLGSCVMTARL